MMRSPLQLAFLSEKRFAFDPTDYLGHGVGGSECALILLTRALARRGHIVHVYNHCPHPGIYDGVEWHPYREFQANTPRDAVISLRLVESLTRQVAAPVRGVWIHDSTLPGATEADQRGTVNLWVAVSKTQKTRIERDESIESAHWFVSRNALDDMLYGESHGAIAKIAGQAIYCSAPDRGLARLLRLWPAIRSRCPWASLVVTGSFALWGNSDEENERFCKNIYALASPHPEIRIQRRVPKQEMAIMQRQSEVMLYPTGFDEMFCISALECQALGIPVVSSRRAAMIDRVEHGRSGYLVRGAPQGATYGGAFVDAAAKLLTDQQLRAQFSAAAVTGTGLPTYDDVAVEWEAEMVRRLRTPA